MTLDCGMRGAGPAMRIFGTQRRNPGRHLARTATLAVAASLAASTALAAGATAPAAAATPLNIFVGYMDTHTVASSSSQPNPWPYTDPSSYVGSPCSNFGHTTTCWDASAIRLDNPGSSDVTGVQAEVDIGSKVYKMWGTSLTVKAHGMLVLTETGAQNSTNFDGSDYPPNAYNGGNLASCANSGAIPAVKITIAGTTTTYLDSGQVLNGGGVDSGHCLNGTFVSGRMDESRQWVQIGSAAPGPPTAPQSLAATAGSGSVTLSWAAPASNGGASITGFDVYRGTSPGGESGTPVATNVPSLSYTDTSVTNGTTYYYRVAAVNSAGISPQSNEAFATPNLVQATVPSAPQGLAATGGNASVKLSWSAPASNGGAAITGYDVYRGTTAGGESGTPVASNVTATSYTDASVTNGTAYYYTVAAVNAVGVSAPSAEVPVTPRATVPSAPSGLVASGGNGSVVLSWATPATDGGAGITGYDVYRGTSPGGESGTPVASGVGTTTFTDTSVTNGTAYYYTVAAVNSVGVSAHSGEASATPHAAVTVPSAPQALAATGGNASVTLSWSAPASNGGAAIAGYDIYRGTTAGGESATPVASNVTATSYTDTGLTNGTTYYYTVAAVNSAGLSPPSGEASATPRPTVPSAPLAVTAAGANASVSLAWSAPASTGGAPVTGYDVYRGTTAGGESGTPVASNVTATSYTDTSVTNGTTYYYTVAAVNSAGISPRSSEVSATPQPPASAAYVRRAGSVTASSSRTTTSVPVSSPGVVAGHTLVVSMLLSSTSSITGAVSIKDSAGNSYVLARDVNDGSAGDRTVVFVGVNVKALPAGGSITLTYPSSDETHVSADEFAGIAAIDTSAGASATTAAFSSGSTPATSQASELLIGSVGIESGKAPAWSAGWTALPTLSVSSDFLGAAYRIVTATGSYAATGTTSGQWMAGIVTLKTS